MCQIFRERHPVLGIMMTAAGISPSAGTIRCVKCSVSTISILTDTPGRPWHCLPHCTDENMETLRDQRQLAQGHTARILNPVLSDTRIFILCTIKYKTILNIKYCPTFDTEWQQWLFLQRQRKKILLAPRCQRIKDVWGSKRKRRGGRREGVGSHISPIPSLHLDLRIRSKWSQTTKLYIPGRKVLWVRALLPFLYPRYSKVNFPRKEFILQRQRDNVR